MFELIERPREVQRRYSNPDAFATVAETWTPNEGMTK
jgi:hypothetical protein